jgi:hypothetical protein
VLSSSEIPVQFARPKIEEPSGPLVPRQVKLEVDDMQKTADYLRSKDVDIVWGPRARETHSRAEICDPNGYHIELRQWFR